MGKHNGGDFLKSSELTFGGRMNISDFPILKEIKESYVVLRRDGFSRSFAEATMVKEYHSELLDEFDIEGQLFWVGLADAQYAYRELSEEVANHALSALKRLAFFDNISVKDIQNRKERYSLAPMPERKKINSPKKFRCDWKIGDTFLHRLSGPDAEAYGIDNRIMLFRKVDEAKVWDGRVLPIVTLSLLETELLPSSSADFLQTPLLKLASKRFGTTADLFEYRAQIMFTQKKQLEAFVYVGNFTEVPTPCDEIVIQTSGHILMIHPKRLDSSCCAYWKRHLFYQLEK